MAMPTRFCTSFNESLRKQQKISDLSIDISSQKIYAAQSQQQYILLVGIDIDFVVTN